MDNIAEWLASITWPLVSRVFTALGIGTLTYTGADQALRGALNAAKTGFQGMASDILQLLAMAGFFDAMAIMSGGLIAGLSWLVMKKFALQTSGTT